MHDSSLMPCHTLAGDCHGAAKTPVAPGRFDNSMDDGLKNKVLQA